MYEGAGRGSGERPQMEQTRLALRMLIAAVGAEGSICHRFVIIWSGISTLYKTTILPRSKNGCNQAKAIYLLVHPHGG